MTTPARHVLARLLAALDALDVDVGEAKVDLERSRAVDLEVEAAREEAVQVLGGER